MNKYLSEVEQRLPRTSPEQQGIDSGAILQFIEALESQIHELHSFMLLRHGCVVAGSWWSPYKREHPHMVFSLSKSFTSTAVGLAVSEGLFAIDDPVLPFFPDEQPPEINDHLAAMRVRHLLTMSTGHDVDTWAVMMDRPDGNWIKGFFEVPVVHAPGTHFLYNTGATYILSAIVQKMTGMKLVDYLEPRLFAPLGIEGAFWEESPQGITTGGIGLRIKTEDIARFGQLYLQKGMWQGKQLLPEAWIAEATASQISNGDDEYSDWTQGYGYQFWRCRHNAYRGDGVFGQYCVVMPEYDVVLAITGGVDVLDMQQPLDIVWDVLLPAIKKGAPDENSVNQQRLTEKLATLALLPVPGQAASPLSAQIFGRTYAVALNALEIETIALYFTESGCEIEVKTTTDEETIQCGYDHWQYGQTALFGRLQQIDPAPIAASGAWTAEDTFTIIARLYETPFFYTLVAHVAGDELLIEIRINASLEAAAPLILMAAVAQ